MDFGINTNTYAENMVVKLLLCFVKERDCKSLQVFGDFMNVINWTNKFHNCQNMFLLSFI